MTQGVFVPLGGRQRRSGIQGRVGWIMDQKGCDIWQGARTVAGYGKAYRDGWLQLVHRYRYEKEIGPIPDGMDLDHFVCNNGPGGCCNPHHCRPASHRENVLRSDSPAAFALSRTHCPEGHPYAGDNLHLEPDGHRRCLTCRREKRLVSYYRNHERNKEQRRLRQAGRRDEVNARQRAYLAANPEKAREYSRRQSEKARAKRRHMRVTPVEIR